MMNDTDPPRLFADLPRGSRLKVAIDEARLLGPSHADLAAMGAALGVLSLHPPIAPAAPTHAVAGWSASVTAKVALAVCSAVVGAGLLAGVVTLRHAPPVAPAPPAAARAVSTPPADPVGETETAPVRADPAPAAAAPSPATSSPRPSRVIRSAHSDPATLPADPAEATSELELIDRAERELGRAPDRALEIAIEHAQAYPAGTLAEERDAIRIVALAQTGRVAEARERAQAFASAHPGSPYARRIENALARASQSAAPKER
jgi:hypothetical protein